LASSSELIPLFVQTYNAEDGDWKRIANFVYPDDGVPGSICSTCYTQLNWISAYQKQIYENDCYLRSLAAKKSDLHTEDDLNIELQEDEIVQDYSPGIGTMNTQQFYDDAIAKNPDKPSILYIQPIDNKETGEVIQSFEADIENSKSVIVGEQDIDGPEMESMDFETNNEDTNEKVGTTSDKQDSSSKGVWRGGKTENTKPRINGDKFECFCGKKFTWKISLQRHQKTHDDSFTDSLKCSTCEKKFSTKEFRDDHVKTVHQGYYYECPLCHKTNSYKKDLANHIKKEHPGEVVKPLECKN
jgi:hypothetical protein